MTRYKANLKQLLVKTNLVFLLVCTTVSGFSQNDTVRINSDYQIMYCSATNGTVLSTQEIQLLLEGPKDKKWYVSFSVNNTPAIILNDGAGIDVSEYSMSLFFKNTSGNIKNYTIELKEAWLEDLSPIVIPEESKSATIQVMALADPEIEDYPPKAKINTSQNYSAKVGKNSNYSVWVPKGACLQENESEIENNKQKIKLKIKWPNQEETSYFKLIETDAFGCNSDTIFAGMEVVKSFHVTFDDNIKLCEGETIILSPIIDLPSDYSYLWSTGENTKEISIDQEGSYSLTVTDLNDNQIVKSKLDIIAQQSPIINIEDHVILDDANPIIDAFKKGSSYLWSDGSTDSELNILESGSYSVTVTSSNGCSSTKSFAIKMKSELFDIILPATIQMCGNEKMNLEPDLSIDQEYLYEWSTGSTESSIIIEEKGDYSVTVSDPDGFQKSASTQIQYHTNPIVDLGSDLILRDGESEILDADNEGASYIWNTGDTTQTITVDSGGEFIVEVLNQYDCSNKDTLLVDYREGQRYSVFIESNEILCEGDSILLNAEIEGSPESPLTFNWEDLNTDSAEIYVKDSGQYCINVTDVYGNTESDCIDITLFPKPEINLTQELSSSNDQEIILDAGISNCTYNWSTNEITQTITVETNGLYWVEASNNSNCSARDSLNVIFSDNYHFLPNAFSPNGDGHNDKLFVRGDDVKEVSLIIYNRLGHKLFETTNINTGWDGFFKGQLQDIDVYVYVLEVTFLDGKTIVKKGNVALLR